MATAKKTSTNKKASANKNKKNKKRWVATVTTDSTHPEPGLFTKSASAIASALASKKVSPKGPASGMRMLNYFINRAGSGLSRQRRTELERAKELLSRRIRKNNQTEDKAATRKVA
jgi:hypothetical protein